MYPNQSFSRTPNSSAPDCSVASPLNQKTVPVEQAMSSTESHFENLGERVVRLEVVHSRTNVRVESKSKSSGDFTDTLEGKVARLTAVPPKSTFERKVGRFHRQQREDSSLDIRKPSVAYRIFKTSFDMVGATALLVATLPIMAVVAVVIKRTSPGPVIFRQRRLTKEGKEFWLYKFRSMNVDAEAKSGAAWAETNDPRITKVGSFIRNTRIDELPQLVNVLKGEMSLIGPRPERPEFAVQIEEEVPGFYRRLEVKAGLTGLAQVGNGYSSCMDGHRKKLAWDRLYIQKQSIALDLWISIKTVFVMLTGHGAR